MPDFQREQAHTLWEEILPLLERHKAEVSHYPDIVLNPDCRRYEAMEDLGKLRCFTARVDGRLVGYEVLMVDYNLHYQDSLQAYQDVLFVDRSSRRAGLGLLKYATEQLRAEDVQAEYQHVKAGEQIREALKALVDRTDVGRLLELLGYELVDLIYAKRLDRNPGGDDGR